MNWKAFARTDQMMVNTFEDTSSQEVAIWMNLENHGYVNHYDIQEENIRLAATLSDMLATKGIPVSIFTNGLDGTSRAPIHVPAGTGRGHQATVLQSLSRIDLTQPVSHLAPELSAAIDAETMTPFIILISNYCQTRSARPGCPSG